MTRKAKGAGTKPSSGLSERQRLVTARMVLGISVVVYLGLAGLSYALLPAYQFIPVVLVAFGAHSAAFLFNRNLR
jgi:hypothetical protein